MSRSLLSVSCLALIGVMSSVGCGDGDCTTQPCSEFGGSSDRSVTTCVSSGSGSAGDEFVVKDANDKTISTCTRAADDNDGCGVTLIAAKESYCKQQTTSGTNGSTAPKGPPEKDCGLHSSLGSCGPYSDNCNCGASCWNPAPGTYECLFRCFVDSDCEFVALGVEYGRCRDLGDGWSMCDPKAKAEEEEGDGEGEPACSAQLTYTDTTCTSCMNDSCCAEDNACADGSSCLSYLACGRECTTQACLDDCEVQFPTGKVLFEALASCSQTHCRAECE